MGCIIKYCVLPLLLTLTITVSGSTPEDNYGFETFVMIAMKNYSSWLVSRNLDPTPLIPIVVHIIDEDFDPMWNYSAKIWNQKIFNHSNIYSWEVESDLDASDFTIRLDFTEFNITGEYQAEGIFLEEPVIGSGKVDMNVVPNPMFGGPYLHVSFENFGITPDGYVDLTPASISQNYVSNHNGMFEGLSAGGFEDRVSDGIGVRHQAKRDEWLPLAQFLQIFLQELFAEVPLSDIIGNQNETTNMLSNIIEWV